MVLSKIWLIIQKLKIISFLSFVLQGCNLTIRAMTTGAKKAKFWFFSRAQNTGVWTDRYLLIFWSLGFLHKIDFPVDQVLLTFYVKAIFKPILYHLLALQLTVVPNGKGIWSWQRLTSILTAMEGTINITITQLKRFHLKKKLQLQQYQPWLLQCMNYLKVREPSCTITAHDSWRQLWWRATHLLSGIT